MNGIITIIPANWTTSGRRRRSPIRPNRALIAPASATSTTSPATASTTLPWKRKPEQHGGGTDEQHGADDREDHLVDRAGDAGQRARHGERGEPVVQAVGVVDRGGDTDVGSRHHGGDGEHRRGQEVDVADAVGEAGLSATLRNTWLNSTSIAIGIVSENISSCGTRARGAQVASHERGELVTAAVAFARPVVAVVADTVVIVVAVMIGLQSSGEVGEDVVEARGRDVEVADVDLPCGSRSATTRGGGVGVGRP